MRSLSWRAASCKWTDRVDSIQLTSPLSRKHELGRQYLWDSRSCIGRPKPYSKGEVLPTLPARDWHYASWMETSRCVLPSLTVEMGANHGPTYNIQPPKIKVVLSERRSTETVPACRKPFPMDCLGCRSGNLESGRLYALVYVPLLQILVSDSSRGDICIKADPQLHSHYRKRHSVEGICHVTG